MDQGTRNTLRNTVTQCRRLLEEATTQALQGRFGIFAVGRKGEIQVEDEARMTHLSEEDHACRRDLIDHLAHIASLGYKRSEALEQLIREIAFTHLNRLCAYKMMEARALIREAVSRGLKSQGFFFYLADHPDIEKLHATGQQEAAYRHFLDWLGGTLSQEIGVLFNPNDPANRVYPPQRVIDDVLALINDESLRGIWEQDETIGWVYQYFTPKELRDKVRKESQAPRNSYELAFRNQFFTPRYVVEFLTDNTLGRIWYEMRQGTTTLTDRCRYLVRRPNEVFIAKGEQPPAAAEPEKELSQEELLRQPVHIPFRAKKDPRELRILDPACGSGHFLLYCFDLLLVIYEEAYDDAELGAPLRKDYPSLEDLRKAIPGLILRHNLHGIDIDLRATQIAALALWLRCQRAYQAMNLKNGQRPPITRSNIVCAEPMPGDTDMLREFTAELQPKALGQLVEEVFEKMKLAGEAGSLLKIEEDISAAAAKAKDEYLRWKKHKDASAGFLLKEYAPKAELDLLDFADLGDERFLDRAEEEIVVALRRYVEHAGSGSSYRRKLFAEDAGRGFAFIDVCRNRYDVSLMNPPFGDPAKRSKRYLEDNYVGQPYELYSDFIERAVGISNCVGAITSHTFLTYGSLSNFRKEVLVPKTRMQLLADFGLGVMDAAMVRSAAYVINSVPANDEGIYFRLVEDNDKQESLKNCLIHLSAGHRDIRRFVARQSDFQRIEQCSFAYWAAGTLLNLFDPAKNTGTVAADILLGVVTSGNDQFLRLSWEVHPGSIRRGKWAYYCKGGDFQKFFRAPHLVVDWRQEGRHISTGNSSAVRLRDTRQYFRPGLTFPLVNEFGMSVSVLPSNCIFDNGSPAVFPLRTEWRWVILGLLNSRVAEFFIRCLTSTRHWQVGYVRQVPWPSPTDDMVKKLENEVREACRLQRSLFDSEEVGQDFQLPRLLQGERTSSLASAAQAVLHAQDRHLLTFLQHDYEIDEICLELFGLDSNQKELVKRIIGPHPVEISPDVLALDGDTDDDFGAEGLRIHRVTQSRLESDAWKTGVKIETIISNRSSEPDKLASEITETCEELASYICGCALGRWDIRFATGERQLSELPAPFAPLPACPPGMLQSQDDLPAKPEDVPADYPIQIDWDGILTDDAEHGDDVVRRIRDVLSVIWKERAEAIEREACEILGVRELRDYFRKPGNGGFWMDHVKRYSKSRRKAPIYWYLRSAKGNYGLWLYYHRLDKDTYFKCLVNYVEPKLRMEEDRLQVLRTRKAAIGSAGREAKQIEKDIDRQEQFVTELHDFRDKLRHVADLHLVPDLNDGVILNIAPLHELVPWKEAEKSWEALQDAKYDWAHIAYQLWPDRVRDLCKRDRSVAIAHGLEDICEVEPPKNLRAATPDDDEAEGGDEDDQDE